MCAREDGIRGSKDLRAEIGKFPNSTNERKQMSITTLKKRIALVAVSALTAGVLSVASAPVANAALSDVDPDTYSYTATGSVGICSAPTNTAAASAGTVHSTANNATQALGEVLAGGTVAFTRSVNDQIATAGDTVSIVVTGGTISGVTDALNPVYAPGFTTLAQVNSSGSAASLASGFFVNAPTAGALQITITRNATGASATTVEIYALVVSTKCATGAFSAANSFLALVYQDALASASVPATNVTTTTAAVDTAGSGSLADSAARIANGGTAHLAVRIMDGQSTPAIVTTAGVFGATATNGAIVSWDGTTSLALESSSAVESVAAGNQFNTLYIKQGAANKNKPMTTSVSVTYNGAVVGSRTVTFTGKPTAITIDTATAGIAKVDTANVSVASYEITDAAGNKLTTEGPGITGSGSGAGNTANVALVATSGVVVDTVNQSLITNTAFDIGAEIAPDAGRFGWTCGANAAGTADVYLKYTASDLSSLISNTLKAQCADTAVNYKASLDKASYLPGDIATLTITATDSKGKPVFDRDSGLTATGVTLGTHNTAVVSITMPQLTAVTAPTNSDKFSAGKVTYKFTVGTTEGSFAGVVDLPKFNSTTYAQTAQTLSYKVAASSASVSNADVLKSIVALIASINKQIQALQKLILARR